MPLSDLAIKKVQPTRKKQKRFDGGGLFLEVNGSGSKLWRIKNRFGGKEKLLSIGPYPLISLEDTRDKRDDAKRLILDGQDLQRGENSHKVRILRRLESCAFPWIGKRTIGQLPIRSFFR